MVAPVSPLVTGRTVIDRNGDIYQYAPPNFVPGTPPPVGPMIIGGRVSTDSIGDVFEYVPPNMVQRSLPPPPVNSSPPAISILTGGPVPGSQVVRTNPGTWVPPGPYLNQWRSGGVNIPGATANSYVIQETDVGNQITLVITVTNEGGSVSATSNAVGPITSP